MPRQSEALPKTCGKDGVFVYPVSKAFLQAVRENTRRYYWTGKITTTKGVVYEFGPEDILKGSGYISSQCCGSNEIELGTVYASEMGITLFSQIDRYTLEDALVELTYHGKIEINDYVGRFGIGGVITGRGFAQTIGFETKEDGKQEYRETFGKFLIGGFALPFDTE